MLSNLRLEIPTRISIHSILKDTKAIRAKFGDKSNITIYDQLGTKIISFDLARGPYLYLNNDYLVDANGTIIDVKTGEGKRTLKFPKDKEVLSIDYLPKPSTFEYTDNINQINNERDVKIIVVLIKIYGILIFKYDTDKAIITPYKEILAFPIGGVEAIEEEYNEHIENVNTLGDDTIVIGTNIRILFYSLKENKVTKQLARQYEEDLPELNFEELHTVFVLPTGDIAADTEDQLYYWENNAIRKEVKNEGYIRKEDTVHLIPKVSESNAKASRRKEFYYIVLPEGGGEVYIFDSEMEEGYALDGYIDMEKFEEIESIYYLYNQTVIINFISNQSVLFDLSTKTTKKEFLFSINKALYLPYTEQILAIEDDRDNVTSRILDKHGNEVRKINIQPDKYSLGNFTLIPVPKRYRESLKCTIDTLLEDYLSKNMIGIVRRFIVI